MYRPNTLKQRIARGEKVYGSWSVLGSPFATQVICEAGFDFIIIDHEHGIGDHMSLGVQLLALESSPTVALVRVPRMDGNYMRRVLDLGAAGLVTPSVETADEARQIVDWCRYPPHGNRGAAPGTIRASGFGIRARDYAATANDNVLLAVQIETVEGVRNAAEIAAVDGIDMIFIGPYDLSASAGVMGQMSHPSVMEMIESVEQAAKVAGKSLGSVLWPGKSLEDMYERGYALISSGSDASRLHDACVADIRRFREAVGLPVDPDHAD